MRDHRLDVYLCLCEILGLDPKTTMRATVEIAPEDSPRVTVAQCIEEESDGVGEFRLVPADLVSEYAQAAEYVDLSYAGGEDG